MTLRETLILAALAVLTFGSFAPPPAAASEVLPPADTAQDVPTTMEDGIVAGVAGEYVWGGVLDATDDPLPADLPAPADPSSPAACVGICAVNGAAEGAIISGKRDVTCSGSICGYTFDFGHTYTNNPVAVCSAGPYTKPGWNPLVCMVEWTSTTQVRVAIDSTEGSQSMQGQGTKHIWLVVFGV